MSQAEGRSEAPLAVRLLGEELDEIERGFARLGKSVQSGEAAAQSSELRAAIDRYLRLEAETLFPLLEQAGVEVNEARATHDCLREELEQAGGVEQFPDGLKRAFDAHRAEQQKHTIPRLAPALGDELAALAVELEERRQALRGAYGV